MLHFDQITAQKWQIFYEKKYIYWKNKFFEKLPKNWPQQIAVKPQVPTYIF
jgi:hypothetical protein